MRVYKTQHPYYCGIDLHAIPMQPGDPLEREIEKIVPDSAFKGLISPYQGICLYSVGWPQERSGGVCGGFHVRRDQFDGNLVQKARPPEPTSPDPIASRDDASPK
jgi:hypothetical protein